MELMTDSIPAGMPMWKHWKKLAASFALGWV